MASVASYRSKALEATWLGSVSGETEVLVSGSDSGAVELVAAGEKNKEGGAELSTLSSSFAS